jgi:DNA invertase Pin-like site-specific DNA recombinase
MENVTVLEERGIGLRSLQESIDTTTSGGRLIFHVFGALAEFERNLIRERTRAGFGAVRARGRKCGRLRALDSKKTELAYSLYDDRGFIGKEIC